MSNGLIKAQSSMHKRFTTRFIFIGILITQCVFMTACDSQPQVSQEEKEWQEMMAHAEQLQKEFENSRTKNTEKNTKALKSYDKNSFAYAEALRAQAEEYVNAYQIFKAKKKIDEALNVLNNLKNINPVQTIKFLTTKAHVLMQNLDDMQQAEQLLHQAQSILKENRQSETLVQLEVLFYFSMLYQVQNDFFSEEKKYKEYVALLELLLRANKLNEASAKERLLNIQFWLGDSTIGEMERIGGDASDGFILLENTAEEMKKLHGEEYHQLCPLNVSLYRPTSSLFVEDLSSFKQIMKKTLFLCIQHNGANHPYTALVYANLGLYYSILNRHNIAESSFKMAINVFDEYKSWIIPAVACKLILASILLEQKKYSGALPYYYALVAHYHENKNEINNNELIDHIIEPVLEIHTQLGNDAEVAKYQNWLNKIQAESISND